MKRKRLKSRGGRDGGSNNGVQGGIVGDIGPGITWGVGRRSDDASTQPVVVMCRAERRTLQRWVAGMNDCDFVRVRNVFLMFRFLS